MIAETKFQAEGGGGGGVRVEIIYSSSETLFDIPSIIFERFAYLKWTPKAYMLKIYHKNNQEIFIALCSQEKIIFSNPVNKIYTEMCCIHRLNKTIHSFRFIQ